MAQITVGAAKNAVMILQINNLYLEDVSQNAYMRGHYRFKYIDDSEEGFFSTLYRDSTEIASSNNQAEYVRITLNDSSIKADGFSTQPPVTGGTPIFTVSATDSDYQSAGVWSYDNTYYTFVSFTSMDTTEYTVTYNASGGSVSPTSVVYSGTPLVLPTPTRAGYTFDGWFTAATGGTQVSSPYEPDANVTLYAHWTQDKVRTLKSLNAPVLNAQSLGVDVQRVYSFGVLVWER